MLQRLSIAQTLLTDPQLLILDEPTNGLDPYSQWKTRQIIAALRSEGKTILICSHYLVEVEMLCDTIGILQRGQLIRQGAVADLVHSHETVEILLADGQDATEIANRLGITAHMLATQHNLMRIPASAQQTVLSALVGSAIPILELHPLSQTLEEVYIHATRPKEETPMMM
jgi:ABC-2 type transport system ATP-binding protein